MKNSKGLSIMSKILFMGILTLSFAGCGTGALLWTGDTETETPVSEGGGGDGGVADIFDAATAVNVVSKSATIVALKGIGFDVSDPGISPLLSVDKMILDLTGAGLELSCAYGGSVSVTIDAGNLVADAGHCFFDGDVTITYSQCKLSDNQPINGIMHGHVSAIAPSCHEENGLIVASEIYSQLALAASDLLFQDFGSETFAYLAALDIESSYVGGTFTVVLNGWAATDGNAPVVDGERPPALNGSNVPLSVPVCNSDPLLDEMSRCTTAFDCVTGNVCGGMLNVYYPAKTVEEIRAMTRNADLIPDADVREAFLACVGENAEVTTCLTILNYYGVPNPEAVTDASQIANQQAREVYAYCMNHAKGEQLYSCKYDPAVQASGCCVDIPRWANVCTSDFYAQGNGSLNSGSMGAYSLIIGGEEVSVPFLFRYDGVVQPISCVSDGDCFAGAKCLPAPFLEENQCSCDGRDQWPGYCGDGLCGPMENAFTCSDCIEVPQCGGSDEECCSYPSALCSSDDLTCVLNPDDFISYCRACNASLEVDGECTSDSPDNLCCGSKHLTCDVTSNMCASCGAIGDLCCNSGASAMWCDAGAICQYDVINDRSACFQCGGTGDPCCVDGACDNSTDVCFFNTETFESICTVCNNLGEYCDQTTPCCAGYGCDLQLTECVVCGGEGAPCCAGNNCNEGLSCDSMNTNTCMSCAGAGSDCSTLPCCGPDTVCGVAFDNSSVCMMCGGQGQVCCAGDLCTDPATCREDGWCHLPDGNLNEACLDGGCLSSDHVFCNSWNICAECGLYESQPCCPPDNACDAPNQCVDGFCSPAPGSMGGPCRDPGDPLGECDGGLACQGGYCYPI